MARNNSKVQNTTDLKRALNVTEAARFVGVSRGTIMNWLISGILPFEELPGRGDGSHRFRLIRRSDLDAFLERYYHSPSENEETKIEQNEIILLERTS